MRAVLVVSFGTSVNEARLKNIEAVEQAVGKALEDYSVYRAYTSRMIIRKLWERDHLKIWTVGEAMESLGRMGVSELIVQPTHLINGYENDQMWKELRPWCGSFASLRVGTPLLTTTEDQRQAILAVVSRMPELHSDEACVLMGHGTGHFANSTYAGLDYMLKEMGYDKVHVGTVEAYPGIGELVRRLERDGVRKVFLMPFMLVAGEHARNDMAGEQDSWKQCFQNKGMEVECILRGLGEYPGIQALYVSHAMEAPDCRAD